MIGITIVTACDNTYSQHLGVLLCSIFENKKPDTVIEKIIVLSEEISDANKIKFRKLKNKYNFCLEYKHINSQMFADLVLRPWLPHQSTYYRVAIPTILSKDISKILYLDCDIVVIGDLGDLWKTDITNYYVGAVVDKATAPLQKIFAEPGDGYFNAGVLLVNLDKWRADNVGARIFNFMRANPDKLLYCDQDGINAVINRHFIPLAVKFNFMSALFKDFRVKISFFKHRATSDNEPVIIHYTGPKPWLFFNEQRHKLIYYKYLWKTPWRFYIPSDLRLKNISYHQIKYTFLDKHPAVYNFLKLNKRRFRNIFGF